MMEKYIGLKILILSLALYSNLIQKLQSTCHDCVCSSGTCTGRCNGDCILKTGDQCSDQCKCDVGCIQIAASISNNIKDEITNSYTTKSPTAYVSTKYTEVPCDCDEWPDWNICSILINLNETVSSSEVYNCEELGIRKYFNEFIYYSRYKCKDLLNKRVRSGSCNCHTKYIRASSHFPS